MEFVIDVESDGPCPGIQSMISFAIVDVNDFTNNFKGLMKPMTMRWEPSALAISSITREDHLKYPDPNQTMSEFKAWIEGQSKERHTLWSDNIAYDWMWIHYYQWYFLGESYFGWSGRRIGDVYSGHMGSIKNHSGWKKWRKTKHTHDPLDDAIGNAEALLHLKERMKK